jgi:hypothetical protein
MLSLLNVDFCMFVLFAKEQRQRVCTLAESHAVDFQYCYRPPCMGEVRKQGLGQKRQLACSHVYSRALILHRAMLQADTDQLFDCH